MVLEARGPRNNFALGDAQRYVFIAGGIGITPILAMVREAQRRGADWTLLYGGRCRESMAFVDELREFEGRVTLHPEAERGLLPLVDHLATPAPGALVYCCGPERLIEAVSDAMAAWPPGSLHVERFRPVAPIAGQEDGDHEFELEAAASGVRVRVPVGMTVVRALESVGVYPATSCEEGICGTCETKVLEGVPDHRDSLLSPEEQQAGNSMMICVSRCRGPRLVLDI
jgi:ferredoxin-NADP reductase